VATPIGNLGDISARALAVLRFVDSVAAEDTRVTGRLLAHFGIDKPLLALHQHNERHAAARVLSLLERGQAVALTTDAGTPGMSDPGAVLVRAAREALVPVLPVPGASALAAAWSVSGFGGPFLFQGFLPARAQERRKALAALTEAACALVFYEAPHRIVATAADLAAVLGAQRHVVIARELTKAFESIHACALGELAAWLDADANRQRGEFVLIVAGAAPAEPQHGLARAVLGGLLEELAPAQAARLAARIAGVPRGTLYEQALALKGHDGRAG
jgi:16S rRNA (cytidine1402-2'-O)-methyltransferase